MFAHIGLVNFNGSVSIRTIFYSRKVIQCYSLIKELEICADYIAAPSVFVCRLMSSLQLIPILEN
jgi:hypothetical protein